MRPGMLGVSGKSILDKAGKCGVDKKKEALSKLKIALSAPCVSKSRLFDSHLNPSEKCIKSPNYHF